MFKKFFPVFAFISIIYNLTSTVYGVELESPRFRIDVGKIEFDTKEKGSSEYSLKTRFGNQADNLPLQGFALKAQDRDEISFSINPTLSTLTKTNTQTVTDLMYSSPSGFQIGLIQEYALKNTSGDVIENAVYYSREGKFLPIPSQNKGDFPAVLIFSKDDLINGKSQLKFKLNPQSIETNRMYETIVNFIALPGY